jgi:hypothetical protein
VEQGRKISNSFSLVCIFIIVVTISFVRISKPPLNNLRFDTYGYYLYLPAAFIYGDLGLQDKEVFDSLNKQYGSSPTFYQANPGPNGNWIMKYSMGMAVLYSPAFVAGHLLALNSAYPPDGFSLPYQRALMYYNILIALVGLIVLRKVLLRFFPDTISGLVLLLIYFGTNYFSYSTLNAEMPHNYLFTLYAFILWFTIKWHEQYHQKYTLFLGLSIGLATLARPSELIALVIPLFWDVSNLESFKAKLLLVWNEYRNQLLLVTTLLLGIGSLQVIYWMMYAGQPLFFSYQNPGEGFEFLWPYTIKFLLSFRKGWLVYTPLMIFGLWGIYLLWKRNRKVFFSVFIFFILNLYIVSSWSCWWYAQSMGQRAMVQSYAIMSIPLGYALLEISRFSVLRRVLIYLVIGFFVLLNLFQTWQMRFEIISRDRMTFAYYVQSFGKTKKDPSIENLLLIDREGGGPAKMPENVPYNVKTLKLNDFESADKKTRGSASNKVSRSGDYALKMDSNVNYAATFTIPYKEITDQYYAWIRTTLWVYPLKNVEKTKVMVVVSFQHKNKNYKYRAFWIGGEEEDRMLVANQWNKVTFDYLTPEVRSEKDKLAIYLWNRGEEEIYFDDLLIEACEEESK